MKDSLFGKLLTRVQQERKLARRRTEAELWRRNKLPSNAEGYKLAETSVIKQDGTELVEYRLYKLIDCSVVTISAEVVSESRIGLAAIAKGTR